MVSVEQKPATRSSASLDLFSELYMTGDSAIDAQRTASERSATYCPECEAPPGTSHALDCPLRPVLRYDDYLAECYARGDASVFRAAGTFLRYEPLLEDHQ